MKKLFSLMLLLATMLSFTACSDDNEPEVLRVSFKEDIVTLQYYENYTLVPVVESGNLQLSDVLWLSSNEDVATVVDGVIHAKLILNNNLSYGEGEAIISLSYRGEVLASCKVIVTPIQATSIKLDKHKVDLFIGEELTLNAFVLPEVGVIKNIIWESSDPNVAIVSSEGAISALSAGNTTITASIAGKTVSDKCDVTVSERRVTGISCPTDMKILLGETVQITAAIEPLDATNNKIIWYSSNLDIATVDNDGNIHAVSLGEAIITAKTEDGGFEAQCRVLVVELPEMVTAKIVSGIVISGANSYCSLTLWFNTNTNQSVIIDYIILADKSDNVVDVSYPNAYCKEYSKKYITHYFDASGGITGENMNAEKDKLKGWKFYVQYTWNNQNYTITCVNH